MPTKMLQLFLRFGERFIHTMCVVAMLFIVLLTVNHTTRFANIVAYIPHQSCCDGRALILSALSSKVNTRSVTKHDKALQPSKNTSKQTRNFILNYVTDAHFRSDKYSKWIPNPQQKIVPLLDDPFIIQNGNICRRTPNLDAIVLIHSAAGNFKRRQGIRNTWGSRLQLTKNNMRIIFLLGLTEHSNTQRGIVKENNMFRDIVQGKFIDTYQNLTHKAVLGLRWLKEFCPGERRVLKVDDDVFIDTVKLFSDFDHAFENKQDTIYCNRQDANTSVIQRMENEKWKVNKDEFRNHTYFPLTYCHGFFISMSTSMALQLYEAANNVPFFWIDDIYVYGMLADKVGVSSDIFDIHNLLSLHTYNSLNCFGNEDTKCNLLVGNAPNIDFMQSMWEKMLSQYKNVSDKIM